MIKADEYVQITYGYAKQWQVFCVTKGGPQEVVSFDNPMEAERMKAALVETIQKAVDDTKVGILNGIAKEFGSVLELFR